MSDNQISLKQFIRGDSRGIGIPTARYQPKDRSFKTNISPEHPFISSRDRFYSSESIDVRIPADVFNEEKIREHSEYKGHSVDLAPKPPMPRDIPFSQNPNIHLKMSDMRKQQHEKEQHDYHASIEQNDQSRLGFVTLKTRNPRQKALREIPDTQNPRINESRSDNNLLWRNIASYEPEDGAYEPRVQPRDLRLEKRKERQNAYQQRREAEKKKNEELIRDYLQTKQTWYNNVQIY